MIRRDDLPRVVAVAEENGFRHCHSAGLDMLLYGEWNSVRNAVQLRFAGEKVKATQLEFHPDLHPVCAAIHGQEFWFIAVLDLVRMKLSSYRDRDRVHVRGMYASGLITKEVEIGLSGEQQDRLQHVRESE